MRYPIAPLPMQDYPVPLDSDNGPPKPVISRGARACTVCRAAKMKCVGAEDDGQKPCQRCRRSNSECIFEKHRRGRKPGSKISEASKQLRKIEKSSAAAVPPKIKSMSDIPAYVPSHSSSAPLPPPLPPPTSSSQSQSQSQSQSRNNLFPTLTAAFSAPPPPPPPPPPSSSSSSSTPLAPPSSSHRPPSIQPSDPMEEDDEDENHEETIYPARMIEREGRRHSFFGTVLTNPMPKPSPAPPVPPSSSSSSSSPVSSALPPPSLPFSSAAAFRRIDDQHRDKERGPSMSAPSSSRPPHSPPSLRQYQNHNHDHNHDHNHNHNHNHHHHPYHYQHSYQRDHVQPLSPSAAVAQGHHHRHHHHRRPSSSNGADAAVNAAVGSLQALSSSASSTLPPISSSSTGNPSAAIRYLTLFNNRFLQNSAPIPDPVKAGLLSFSQVELLFDMIFLRLNPFINLFDPDLHTPTYVRDACPFLFTVLCMAGAKFFMPDKFRAIQRMAEELCVRAFQECWKRVEVVQAFMCMTYWREPDDQRTWTFIGYAARMAVELGLNTYYYSANHSTVPTPPSTSESTELLQRRNRERTYLVLWVHDRSLSMQTGRQWMLPEDDLVRNAVNWYRESVLLPIDTVVAAQVELRLIAASVIDIFYLHRRTSDVLPTDVNYHVLLSACNSRLQKWSDDWMTALQKTNGTDFHTAFLTFFKLHVRLFLNSFGLQSSFLVHHHHHHHHPHHPHHSSSDSRPPIPNILALDTCLSSASETLRLVAQDFAKVDMLRYGQDSITVMTAYSAVFLLKLLRNVVQITSIDLGENGLEHVYNLINATADAYQACAKSMSIPLSASSEENEGQSSLGMDPNAEEKMETDPTSGDGATLNGLKSKHGDLVTSNSDHNSGHHHNNNYDNPLVGVSNDRSKTPTFTMVFSSVEYHGRFLRTLVLKDKASRARVAERERKNAATPSGPISTANTNAIANANTNTNTNITNNNTDASTITTGAGTLSNSLGGVSRINTSSLSSSTTQTSNHSTLVVSPTISAAASALHSFAGAGTKGLDGLATVATSSSALANGISGSSSSPRNTGDIIVPSSSSSALGSGNGVATGPLYQHHQHHQHSSHQVPSSSYTATSSSSTPSSHYRQTGTMNSHQLYGASSQPLHSQHISSPHTGNAHSHRSSFSHVMPHQRGSSAAQVQSHVQHIPVQHSTLIQQQPYNVAVTGHPTPTWHFPASPHLPTHPLVSPEDELSSIDLENVVSVPAMVATAMYNHPSSQINNPANNTTMSGLADDDHTSPDITGDHSNGLSTGGAGADGLPPGASAADVVYWYYMHSEMGYGNGALNPLASVGTGMGSNGNASMNPYGGVVNSSLGMNMEILGGGGVGLANMNNGMGQNGVNTTMSVMNTVPGLTVPNMGGLGNVGHTSLNGMSGLGGMASTGNSNMPDHGTGSSVQEGLGSAQIGAGTGPASDVSSKHRAPSTNAAMGYQRHGLSHSQAQAHSSSAHHGSHGSTPHHIPTYHSHGHSTIQNG